jgi:hypothetical protein
LNISEVGLIFRKFDVSEVGRFETLKTQHKTPRQEADRMQKTAKQTKGNELAGNTKRQRRQLAANDEKAKNKSEHEKHKARQETKTHLR